MLIYCDIWGNRDYLESEISRSQLCLLQGLKILGGQDYLVSDISILPKTYYLKSETFGWAKLFWLIIWSHKA